MHSLKEFISVFNRTYTPVYEEIVDFFTGPYSHKESHHLVNSHLKSYLAGGKRIRPYLVTLFSEAATIPGDAIAIELFQSMALTHDDIIDKSETRRDSLTPHISLQKLALLDQETGLHLGILLGDLLLSECFTHLNKENVALFSEMARNTVKGQVLDTGLANNQTKEKKVLESAQYFKTSLYTFVYPMKLGMQISHRNPEEIEQLSNWAEEVGKNLGILYQMRDDVYDYAVTIETGKRYFSDYSEDLPTWVYFWAEQHDTELFSLISQPNTPEEVLRKACEQRDWQKIYSEINSEVVEKIEQNLFHPLLTETQNKAMNELFGKLKVL